jgi:hypothetical protein
MEAALRAHYSNAPHEPGAFRLTLLVGQYWQNSAAMWRAAHDPRTWQQQSAGGGAGWGAAEKLLYSQIHIWYMVCGPYRLFFCNNQAVYDVFTRGGGPALVQRCVAPTPGVSA